VRFEQYKRYKETLYAICHSVVLHMINIKIKLRNLLSLNDGAHLIYQLAQIAFADVNLLHSTSMLKHKSKNRTVYKI